jgi:hypothetical protein
MELSTRPASALEKDFRSARTSNLSSNAEV